MEGTEQERQAAEIKKLTKIPNIGFLRAKALYEAGFSSIEDLASANEEDLAAVSGIGKKTAKRIKNTLKSVGTEKLEDAILEEDLIEEEFDCPMCGTILSAYEAECYECGTPLKKVTDGTKEKALAVYNRKLKIHPRDAEVWYARAILLSELGNLEQAINSFEKVIEVDALFEGVWHAKADVHTKMGDHAKAAESLKSAMKQTLLSLKDKRTEIFEDVSVVPVVPVPAPIKPEKVEKELLLITPEELEEDLADLEGLTLEPEPEEKIPTLSPEELAADLDELKLTPYEKPIPTPTPTPPSEPEPELPPQDDIFDELEDLTLQVEKEMPGVPKPKEAVRAPGTPKPTAEKEVSPPAKPEQPRPEPKPATTTADEIEDMDFDKILQDLEMSIMKEYLSCPVCKQVIEQETDICPNCKTVLKARRRPSEALRAPTELKALKTTLERPIERMVAEGAKEKKRAVLPVPKGRVNGLVNGRGRVNGRVNGLVNGFVNGIINGDGFINGRVNGVGLVNGVGYVNGLSARRRERLKHLKRKSRIYDIVLVTTILVMLTTVSVSVIIFYPTTVDKITIDGNFSDWDGYERVPDDVLDAPADVDIRHISYYKNTYYLKFYLAVEGEIFTGMNNGVDALYVFVDADGDRTNGYEIDGIGSDFLLIVSGWNGLTRSAKSFRFDHMYRTETIRTRDDWGGWAPVAGAVARTGHSGIEAQMPYKLRNGNNGHELSFTFRFVHYENGMPIYEDASPVISNKYSRVAITQRSSAASSLPLASSQDLLDIILTPERAATIHEIAVRNHGEASTQTLVNIGLYDGSSLVATPTVSGNLLRFQFSPEFEITRETIFTLKGNFVSLTHDVIGLKLDFVTGELAATIEDYVPTKSYVGGPPPGIVIDGAFDDWSVISSNTDIDNKPIQNHAIDILGTKNTNTTDSLFFYMETDGAMMSGELIPSDEERKLPPPPGPGPEPEPEPGPEPEPTPVAPLSKVNGRDIARIYLTSFSTGETFKIEITGKSGEIKDGALYVGNDGKWNYVTEINAANDNSRLEVEVPGTLVGAPLRNMSLRYEMTDWLGETDRAENLTTRRSLSRLFAGMTRAPPDWPAEDDWTLFATDSSDSYMGWNNETFNLTKLYYVNDTDYLFIRVMTNSSEWGTLINGTWMLFIDVDGNGSADWLVVENSTGLHYFYNWTTGSEGTWNWSATETLDPTDDEGGGVNTTMKDGYWTINFVLNKTIITNGTTSIGAYTTIGAATNSTEDFVVNETSYQPTVSYLIPGGGNFEDIMEPVQIPEYERLVIPMLGTLILIALFRKRKKNASSSQHKVFKDNSQSHDS